MLTRNEINAMSEDERFQRLCQDFLERDGGSFIRVQRSNILGWEAPTDTPESALSSFFGDRRDSFALLKGAYDIARNTLIAMHIPQKVKLVVNPNATQSATDGKLLFVATDYFDNPSYTPDQKADLLRGLTIHEGGHLLWTDFNAWGTTGKNNILIKNLANILEDERQERLTGEHLGALGLFLAPVKRHYFQRYKTEEEKMVERMNRLLDPRHAALCDIVNTLLLIVRYPLGMDPEVVRDHSAFLLEVKENVLLDFPKTTKECWKKAELIYDMLMDYIRERFGEEIQPEQNEEEQEQEQDGQSRSSNSGGSSSDDESQSQSSSQNASPSQSSSSPDDGDENKQNGRAEGESTSMSQAKEGDGNEPSEEQSAGSGESTDENQGGHHSQGSDNDTTNDPPSQDGTSSEEESAEENAGTPEEAPAPKRIPLSEEEAKQLLDATCQALDDAMQKLSPSEKTQEQCSSRSEDMCSSAKNETLAQIIQGDLAAGETCSIVVKPMHADPDAVRAYNSSARSVERFVPSIRHDLRNLGRDVVRELGGLRSGRLDTEHRLVDAHIGVPNVYTKKTVSKADKINIAVLVDESGSMSRVLDGKRCYEWARDTAVLITRALNGIPNVSTYLYGYMNSELRVYQEGTNAPCQSLGALTAYGGTPTGEAMMEAAARIRRRSADKTIMFVISDGEPNDYDTVKDALQFLSKKSISAVGIGIAGMKMGHLIKESIDVRHMHELPRKLGATVKAAIRANTRQRTIKR